MDKRKMTVNYTTDDQFALQDELRIGLLATLANNGLSMFLAGDGVSREGSLEI